ncbi:hypothetical protein LCGC14_1103440 [marine sediment metagenome]|uniref:Uncharacterized protein n=1 Tax=marine sediment metagenome TaxID=412755 RepID=A0A0F9MWS3_9ZZZZ
MPNHHTFLRYSETTAFFFFLLIGSLFLLAGCAQFYRTLGLSPHQVHTQVSKDQTARLQIIQGIRLTTTEIITSVIAGLGAIASGFLARALGTERKMTKVLITGIEAARDLDVKATIKTKATAAGIQNPLDARVQALT